MEGLFYNNQGSSYNDCAKGDCMVGCFSACDRQCKSWSVGGCSNCGGACGQYCSSYCVNGENLACTECADLCFYDGGCSGILIKQNLMIILF